MQNRKQNFDNGFYSDGKKRIVTIISGDDIICTQNPYAKKQKR